MEHTTKAPPRTRHLLSQVAWFNRLRYVAVAGMAVFSTAGRMLDIIVEVLPLYVLAGVTLFLNLLYGLYFRKLTRASYNQVRRHADLQIALDLLILTAVLHFSGGSTNPFAFFFLFHTFIAAQMVSVGLGLVVAVAALALVGGLGACELSGVLSTTQGIQLMDLQEFGLTGLLGWLLAFGLTMGISVYFVSTVLRQVVKREEEVRQLSLQLGQSEKLASIGTLAAGVAHEINNPVGVIRNKAQILRYRIEDGDEPEALLPELDTIERHADRIGAITTGLLTFSKESPFELKPLDLNKLAKEAAELVRVPFKDCQVQLIVRTTDWPIWVMGSENHLLQVMVNILLNARDASAPGGKVLVVTAGEAGVGSLRIQDEGQGIAPQNLAKIFDPFFTTKDVDRGTGLGLAITHGIVERHQGTITVRSREGEGSAFQVNLPLHD